MSLAYLTLRIATTTFVRLLSHGTGAPQREMEPSVPGCSPSPHATDRLSRALAAHTLIGFSGVDDNTAAGAITDGSNSS
jgi:hypothetical protein